MGGTGDVTVALAILALLPGPVIEPGPAIPAHPLHLSTAQLLIEERGLYLRIRIFRDDLEAALAAHAGRPELRLSPTPAADSLFLAYLETALEITADGEPLPAAVISSGEDLESGQGEERIWWYLLGYATTAPPVELRIRNAVLFDRFDDQRNVMRVLHAASDRQRTLYFAAPDDEPMTVRFD